MRIEVDLINTIKNINRKNEMNKIPPKLRKEMAGDDYYKTCSRKDLLDDHVCFPDPLTGKLLEWEHVMYWKGSQLQRKWCIIPICWLVHRGGKLDKEINEWIALNRASDSELEEISKAVDYKKKRKYLNNIYGIH